MTHTFELSKMISEEIYDELISLPTFRYYKQNLWKSSYYESQGLSSIRLYKFKPKRKKSNNQNDPFFYMITITVNIGVMFGDDGFFSNDILSFTPDFIKSIYINIYSIFPSLEYQDADLFERHPDLWWVYNGFKLRRIDFAFDILSNSNDYIKLIDRGYALTRKGYNRYFFDTASFEEELADDESDIDEYDNEPDNTDYGTYYVYYKCKSLHINIYIKAEQLRRQHVFNTVPEKYNFLRIEVQLKKNKLNALVTKLKDGTIPNDYPFAERDLRCLATPAVEKYLLNEYVSQITGSGLYVDYDNAKKIIDDSSYRNDKKSKLKKVLFYVARDGGISSFLAKVSNGDYSDISKPSTAKQYLKNIQQLGINPVTLPTTGKINSAPFKVSGNSSNAIRLKALPNLIDAIDGYSKQIIEDRLHGASVSEDDIDTIMRL